MAASVDTYTKAGAKASTPAKLDKAVFEIPASPELLKQAYLAYLANGRTNLARTKTRGEVRGSNIKPWRQKGTGRARFGSRYNPIWRGGGITFGPTGTENYSHALTTKTKRQALRQALSLTAKEGRLKVIESLNITDGKTATAKKLLGKMDLTGRVLIVSDYDDKIKRALGNLPDVALTSPARLNTYTVLNADYVVITADALIKVHEALGKAK